MNVHIANDNKFYDPLIGYIKNNNLESNNIFVLRGIKNAEIKYFPEYDNKVLVDQGYDILDDIMAAQSVDKIIIHNLTLDLLIYLNKSICVKNRKICWISWGTDFNKFMGRKNGFEAGLDAGSDRYIMDIYGKWALIKRNIKKTLLFKIYSKIKGDDYCVLLNVIDYYCGWNDYEYLLLKKKYPKLNIEYRYFIYGVANDAMQRLSFVTKRDKKKASKKKILVGHSGYLINNHVSAFETIVKNIKNINDYEIIVPLSYGDERYIEYVKRLGAQLFGESFKPITNFMPKDAYFRMLCSVDVVYMNSILVVGLSNISVVIRSGLALVMRRENAYYQLLVSKGVKIFKAEDVFLEKKGLCNYKLSDSDKSKNKRIIEDMYSHGRMVKGYEFMIK